MGETYPFSLQPLPYAYDALEPYIDQETMHYHHDKHLKTYVENLNKALQPYPAFHSWHLEKILYNIYSFPAEIQTAIRNNAGGVFNHNLYFGLMRNNNSSPSGEFLEALQKKYGSLQNFYDKFKEAGSNQFGSGYAWLVLNRNGDLNIITTANQDTPLAMNLYPLLLVDVWEHAYYLKYKNERKTYLDAFMKVVDWNKVGEIYQNYFKN